MQRNPNTMFKDKLSPEESEKLYDQVAKLFEAKNDEANAELKRLIDQGQGFYAAKAVSLMCTLIDANAFLRSSRDSDSIMQAHLMKQKYIEIALKHNKVMGQYILLQDQLGEFGITSTKTQVDTNLAKFKLYIEEDPASYQKLTAFAQDANKNTIIELQKHPSAEVDQFITDIKDIKTPLDVLEFGYKTRVKDNTSEQLETPRFK